MTRLANAGNVTALTLCAILLADVAVAQPSGADLATVSSVTIDTSTRQRIQSRPNQSVILVATERCALSIDGVKITMNAGDQRTTTKTMVVGPFIGPSAHTDLVVIQVARQTQPLTFEHITLTSQNELDDASSRNETLIVSLGDVRLQVVRNPGDESTWQPGATESISLRRAQTYWQSPGMYHMKNAGSGPANFLLIEW